MHRSRFVLGGLTFVSVLLVSIAAALAFQPPPQSSPQSPSPSVATPSEPAPVNPAPDKALTPSKVEPLLKPTAPTPHTVHLIRPWVVDRRAWPNWLYFYPLNLIATVEKGTKEGDELYAAVQDLQEDFIGRLFVAVEFVDSSTPSIFDQPGGTATKNCVRVRQHDLKTHVSVLESQWADPKATWSDAAFRKKITQSDGERVLTFNDLKPEQLEVLSDTSRALWKKGRLDGKSLRLWIEVVIGKQDTKSDLSPGYARFRALCEKNWVLPFGTRLMQPIIFVHAGDKSAKDLETDESYASAAKLLATYTEAHPWIVNADTKFGKDLHVALTANPEKNEAGVGPPADAASLVCFQILDKDANPKGQKGHMGPYRLDPTKLAGDLENVLDKDVKLTRAATPTLVATQTASVVETVPPKK
jgi:hypothetical protein